MKWFERWPLKARRYKQLPPLNAELSNTGPAREGKLNPGSETWVFIKHHCEKRLAEIRQGNDNASLDQVKTALLRGRIKMLKEILELPKPKNQAFYKPEPGQEEYL